MDFATLQRKFAAFMRLKEAVDDFTTKNPDAENVDFDVSDSQKIH